MKTTIVVFVSMLMLILILTRGVEGKKIIKSDDVEEVHFTSKDDLDTKIKNIKELKEKDAFLNEGMSSKELKELKDLEIELRKDVMRAELTYGEFSKERATALHKLGGNMFRQERFEEIYEIANQIVRIHEAVDGYEAEITGKAWGNIGTVAHRLGYGKECNLAMLRALYIMLLHKDPESRDVLMHRGKMLSFQVPDAESTTGLSHNAYIATTEDEL